MKRNNEVAPYSEDRLKIVWNAKPEEKNTWWEKHETKIFNGIQRGIEYICAGSVIAWLLYWIPIWARK